MDAFSIILLFMMINGRFLCLTPFSNKHCKLNAFLKKKVVVVDEMFELLNVCKDGQNYFQFTGW